MATAKTTRAAWIEAGLAALGAGGPAAVRVEELARRLGVTKGGFYGQFSGREELLAALLDTWELACTEAVVARSDRDGRDPARRAWLAAQLSWAPGWVRDVDLALRDWARSDAEIGARVARVDAFRLDYLERQLDAPGADPVDTRARCRLAFAAAIGRCFLPGTGTALGHGADEEAVADASRTLDEQVEARILEILATPRAERSR